MHGHLLCGPARSLYKHTIGLRFQLLTDGRTRTSMHGGRLCKWVYIVDCTEHVTLVSLVSNLLLFIGVSGELGEEID